MPDESTATWESLGNTPPPAPAEPTLLDPPTPPAEPATLEKSAEPQPAAEPIAARESVSEPSTTEPVTEQPKDEPKPEEYVAEVDDPPEIAALPTPAAKKWAKRQFKEAEQLRRFDNYGHPIAEFVDDLNKRSPSRFAEMLDDVTAGFPDYISQKLFGMSTEDVKSRLQGAEPDSTATELPAELPASDTEAKLAQEKNQLQSQFDALKTELEALKTERATEKQTGREAEIATKQQELYSNVWGVVDEGIRNLGLEPQPADPPKLASLKKAAAKLLDRHNIEAAFDASPENQHLVTLVYEATKRGEFNNAFKEQDNLKVRARAAFSQVANSDEFKAIMEQIEAYANQSKTSSREVNPVPPAPGSSVGVSIKPPTTWDEAITQSQTARAAS